MRGDELSCVCVSSGVPLPQISWPILNGGTKYLSAVSTENIISISNISIPGFKNVNSTVECVGENLIGMKKMEIRVHNRDDKPQGKQEATIMTILPKSSKIFPFWKS